jgi:hypothetical protein
LSLLSNQFLLFPFFYCPPYLLSPTSPKSQCFSILFEKHTDSLVWLILPLVLSYFLIFNLIFNYWGKEKIGKQTKMELRANIGYYKTKVKETQSKQVKERQRESGKQCTEGWLGKALHWLHYMKCISKQKYVQHIYRVTMLLESCLTLVSSGQVVLAGYIRGKQYILRNVYLPKNELNMSWSQSV